jgi:hypothetical protein
VISFQGCRGENVNIEQGREGNKKRKTHLLVRVAHSLPNETDLLQDLGVGELGVLLAELVANRVLVLDVSRSGTLGSVGVLDLLLLVRTTLTLGGDVSLRGALYEKMKREEKRKIEVSVGRSRSTATMRRR